MIIKWITIIRRFLSLGDKSLAVTQFTEPTLRIVLTVLQTAGLCTRTMTISLEETDTSLSCTQPSYLSGNLDIVLVRPN